MVSRAKVFEVGVIIAKFSVQQTLINYNCSFMESVLTRQ